MVACDLRRHAGQGLGCSLLDGMRTHSIHPADASPPIHAQAAAFFISQSSYMGMSHAKAHASRSTGLLTKMWSSVAALSKFFWLLWLIDKMRAYSLACAACR